MIHVTRTPDIWLIKNCLIQILYSFKGDKTWQINFLCVCEGFQNFQGHLHFFLFGPYIFFVIDRKNIQFQVRKKVQILVYILCIVYNLKFRLLTNKNKSQNRSKKKRMETLTRSLRPC